MSSLSSFLPFGSRRCRVPKKQVLENSAPRFAHASSMAHPHAPVVGFFCKRVKYSQKDVFWQIVPVPRIFVAYHFLRKGWERTSHDKVYLRLGGQVRSGNTRHALALLTWCGLPRSKRRRGRKTGEKNKKKRKKSLLFHPWKKKEDERLDEH